MQDLLAGLSQGERHGGAERRAKIVRRPRRPDPRGGPASRQRALGHQHAALILALSSPVAAAATALAMAAFAGLDMFELAHQLHESRSGLAALAATVSFAHLLAAAAALLVLADTRRRVAAT